MLSTTSSTSSLLLPEDDEDSCESLFESEDFTPIQAPRHHYNTRLAARRASEVSLTVVPKSESKSKQKLVFQPTNMDWSGPKTCRPSYVYYVTKFAVGLITLGVLGIAVAYIQQRISPSYHPAADISSDIHSLQEQVILMKELLEGKSRGGEAQIPPRDAGIPASAMEGRVAAPGQRVDQPAQEDAQGLAADRMGGGEPDVGMPVTEGQRDAAADTGRVEEGGDGRPGAAAGEGKGNIDGERRDAAGQVDEHNRLLPAGKQVTATRSLAAQIVFDSLDGHARPIGANMDIIVDEQGRPVAVKDTQKGSGIKLSENGELVDANGRRVTTDEHGQLIGPDGKPLHANTDARVHAPAIKTDARGVPLDAKALGAQYYDAQGNIIRRDSKGTLLDAQGQPILSAVVYDAKGQPVSTDSKGQPLDTDVQYYDDKGRPVRRDSKGTLYDAERQPIQSGMVYDAQGKAVSTDSKGQPLDASVQYFDDKGRPVRRDSKGMLFDAEGRPIQSAMVYDAHGKGLSVDSKGRPMDSSMQYFDDKGRPVRRDSKGTLYDAEGQPIQSGTVYDEHGKAVSTDGTGKPLDAAVQYFDDKGQPVRRDSKGTLIDAQGQPIQSGMVYDAHGKAVSTDSKGKPLDSGAQYFDDKGRPVRRDSKGTLIDAQGQPIRSGMVYDAQGKGVSIDSKGQPLDASVQYFDEKGRPVRRDSKGTLYNAEGQPFQSGTVYDEHGKAVSTDSTGKPLESGAQYFDDKGRPLRRDSKGTLLDAQGQPVQSGMVYDKQGNAISTDSKGKPIDDGVQYFDDKGRPVRRDSKGALYDAEGQPIQSGMVYDAHGKGVSVDSKGKPLDSTMQYFDDNGRPVRRDSRGTLVDAQGQPIRSGIVYDEHGKAVLTDSTGKPLDSDVQYYDDKGRPIRRDSKGTLVDAQGQPVRSGTVYDEHGKAVSADSKAKSLDSGVQHFDDKGQPVRRDSKGTLIDAQGQPIQSGTVYDAHGKAVSTDKQGQPVDTGAQYFDDKGRPVRRDSKGTLVDSQGQPIKSGMVYDAHGKGVSTDSKGQPVDSGVQYFDDKGRPIRRDSKGTLYDAEGQPIQSGMVYDAHGKGVSIDSKGKPLDTSMQYFDDKGRPVRRDSKGTLFDTEGRPIQSGIVYDKHGKAVSTDSTGKPVDADVQYFDDKGRPVRRDSKGTLVDVQGQPIQPGTVYDAHKKAVPADSQGQPLDTGAQYFDDKGRPVRRDSKGNLVDSQGQPIKSGMVYDAHGKEVSTDSKGQPLDAGVQYFDDKGRPIRRDSKGTLYDAEGQPIQSGMVYDAHGKGVSIDSKGKPLDTTVQYFDGKGRPVRRDSKGTLFDTEGRPIQSGIVYDKHGKAVSTDSTGKPVGADVQYFDDKGLPVRRDSKGTFVDAQGQPLQTGMVYDEHGKTVLTDIKGKPVDVGVQYFDDKGRPVRRDSKGTLVDVQGQPIQSGMVYDAHGKAVSTDSQGQSLDTGAQYFDDKGRPVRRDSKGTFVDSQGQPIKSGMVYDAHGKGVSTDSKGQPLDAGVQYFDDKGRPIRRDSKGTLYDTEGQPIQSGMVYDAHGKGVSIDSKGKPLDTTVQYFDGNGRPIRRDSKGTLFSAEGRPIQSSIVYDKHGKAVSTDSTGKPLDAGVQHFDDKSKPIGRDSRGTVADAPIQSGMAYGAHGKEASPDSKGKLLDVGVQYFDEKGRPVRQDSKGTLIDAQGQPIQSGMVYDAHGKAVSTDSKGQPLDTSVQYFDDKGRPVRRDSKGTLVDAQGQSIKSSMVYDAHGKAVSTDSTGQPLDAGVQYFDDKGRPVRRDSKGTLFDVNGQPIQSGMVFDAHGSAVSTDSKGQPLETDVKYFDEKGRPVRRDSKGILFNAQGQPIQSGIVYDSHGRAVSTDNSGLPLEGSGATAQPRRQDSIGAPMDQPIRSVAHGKPASTDIGGPIDIQQYFDAHGKRLKRNSEGAFLDDLGLPILSGAVYDANGKAWSTDSKGVVVKQLEEYYDAQGRTIKRDTKGRLIDSYRVPIQNDVVYDSYGNRILTDRRAMPIGKESEQYYDRQGKMVTRDANGVFIDSRGLPIKGGAIYDHRANKVTLDANGRISMKDEFGLPIHGTGEKHDSRQAAMQGGAGDAFGTETGRLAGPVSSPAFADAAATRENLEPQRVPAAAGLVEGDGSRESDGGFVMGTGIYFPSNLAEALRQYEADKTGKTDFALESAGGAIVMLKQTENFYSPTTILFGLIPICDSANGPRTMIQATSLPGECWAFKGQSGSAIVRLLGSVRINEVAIEHISKDLSPTREISSAPKEFSIFGMDDAYGRNSELLGKFLYDAEGASIQVFQVEDRGRSYHYIEFKVHSNYGNKEYTCVYRLRVHGILDHASRVQV